MDNEWMSLLFHDEDHYLGFVKIDLTYTHPPKND